MSKAKTLLNPIIKCADIIIFWLLAVLIFVLNISKIEECTHIIVLNDELGYWTNAASLLGKNWSEITFDMPWYSFGYSLIILPFMSFIDDTDLLYQVMLYVNVVMLVLTYIVYTRILNKLFPDTNRIYSYIAAAAGAMYTSYQVQVNVAWSETALLLVTALVTYLVLCVIDKPKYLNCAALGAVAVYAYMIHNRSIGIIASAALILFMLVIMRKIKLRYIAVFAAVFVAGYIANSCIKDYLEPLIWGTGEKLNVNEIGGIFGKLKTSFTTVDGFKRWLSLFMSQSFGVFATSACVVMLGLWGMSRRIAVYGVNAVRGKKGRKLEERFYNKESLGLLFIVCSFVASLVISSVFLCKFNRIDQIVYTRYADMTVGIIISIAFCYLPKLDKNDFKFLIFVPIIMYLGYERADILLRQVTFDAFNKLCAPGLALMYRHHETDFSEYFLIAVTMFFVIGALGLIKVKKLNIGCFAAMICCIAFFTYQSSEGEKTVVHNQAVNGASEKRLIDSIAALPEHDLYVLSSCGTFKGICQYYLPDETIKTADSPSDIEEEAYFIAGLKEYIDYSEYEIIDYSAEHLLLKNTVQTKGDYTRLPVALMSVFDRSAYNPENDSITDTDSTILCFGPYLNLSAGEYSFKLDFDIEGAPTEEIGYIECKVAENNTIFSRVELTDDMIDEDNDIMAELEFDLENDIRNMEIVVYLNSPETIEISLNTIEYRKEDAA